MRKISHKWYSVVFLFAIICGYLIILQIDGLSNDFDVYTNLHNITANIKKDTISKTLSIFPQFQEDSFGVMIFGGDVMLGRGVESSVNRNTKPDSINKWIFPWQYIRDEFISADIAFVNLEGSISDIGKDGGKKYSFRFNPETIEGLVNSGIDVVSMANNHAADWGRLALCDSVKRLEGKSIDVVGAGCKLSSAKEPFVGVVGNTSFAIFALTEFDSWVDATKEKPGMAPNDMIALASMIKEQRDDGIDIIIVSMHWGDEYLHEAPKRIREDALIFSDLGVDLVVGHHPHVPQQIEKVGDTWVAYSLGNLIFDQKWSSDTMQGMLLRVTVGGGQIIDVEGLEVLINDKYQPRLSGVKFSGEGSLNISVNNN